MEFIFNDGGRAKAGHKGLANDCVCRSIAIVTGFSYGHVYDRLNYAGTLERITKNKRGISSAEKGVYKATIRKFMTSLGYTWMPTMGIGTGCKVHLRSEELPGGSILVSVSRHLTAVIDGVIHDTHDPSRDGSRCVYGYWQKNNF